MQTYGAIKDYSSRLFNITTQVILKAITTSSVRLPVLLALLALIPQASRAQRYFYHDQYSYNSNIFYSVVTEIQAIYAAPCINTLNTILYVGGFCSVTWGGGDIGSQINAAYAALPASGGSIVVIPQSSGACYSFTSKINFGTPGKYVILQGASPTASGNLGSCLRWTSTIPSVAINIDWTPRDGGGYVTGAGIRDIVLTNGHKDCAADGGCGSLATGVSIGTSNGGAHKALFLDFKVQGFGEGYHIADSVGWGMVWLNSAPVFNSIGIHYVGLHENDSFISGVLNSNGIGVQIDTSGSEFSMIGGSCDTSTVACFKLGIGTTLHTTDVHWENRNAGPITNTQYVISTAPDSILDMSGGIAYDTVTSGTQAVNWFTGGNVTVHGVHLKSFGRTTTRAVFLANTRGLIEASPDTPTQFPILAVNANNIVAVNSNPTSSFSAPVAIAGMLQQIAANSWSGTSACVANTKAVTFAPYVAFTSVPVVLVFDYTTKGGANLIEGPTTSGFTVSCAGATDAFSWVAIGNPE
jgi:hypothetical protein